MKDYTKTAACDLTVLDAPAGWIRVVLPWASDPDRAGLLLDKAVRWWQGLAYQPHGNDPHTPEGTGSDHLFTEAYTQEREPWTRDQIQAWADTVGGASDGIDSLAGWQGHRGVRWSVLWDPCDGGSGYLTLHWDGQWTLGRWARVSLCYGDPATPPESILVAWDTGHGTRSRWLDVAGTFALAAMYAEDWSVDREPVRSAGYWGPTIEP